MLTKDVWDSYFKGFSFSDCAIFRELGYCFLLVEDQPEDGFLPLTRFVTIVRDAEIRVDNVPMAETGGFRFGTIAAGTDPAEYVAVDIASSVYSASATAKKFEKPIEAILDLSAPRGAAVTIRRVVRIGAHVYAVGSDRHIYVRGGVDRWEGFPGEKIPMPSTYSDPKSVEPWGSLLGFNDLSRFENGDFYAAGGPGDVWRFDGTSWTQCPIPTNAVIETVCCAGDGKVYVSDLHGNVWAGREDQWSQVAEGGLSWGGQPVDALWFKGRMYFGAQAGIYVIRNKRLVPLGDVDRAVPSSMVSGRIDISPDGNFMLTAGPYGACLYDGHTWTRLFSAFDFR